MEKTLSLLPYLESGNNGILLDIHVLQPDTPQETSHPFPFQLAGVEKPFTRLIKGGLKCDGSKRIFHPVFMLVQKDTCFSDGGYFNPQTNTTLDHAWLDTIQFFSRERDTFTVPSPPGHPPAQLKPLFYCKLKNCFFHPPCPDCGGELVLCKDDRILGKAGLDSFHTSLNRYLFCPECYESHANHFFYTYARQANEPVTVLDRHGLIKRFKQIKTSISRGFPCVECPEYNACHTTGEKALSRIGFFSFYPFYMLIFKACQINGIEFLHLLSNAQETAEQESHALPLNPDAPEFWGDALSRYLFKDDPRFWLEILFLKYAFFKKILTSIEKRLNDDIKSIFSLNIDSIWINTKSDAGMMPFFWDYELKLMDLVTTRPLDLFQESMEHNQHTNFIAQLWLYTFFVNHDHDAKTVFQSGTAALLQHKGGEEGKNHAQTLFESHSLFRPENIFWKPAPVSLAASWHDLWIQTIDFAEFLVRKKEILDFPSFINNCIRQVNEIQDAVKSKLFSKDIRINQEPAIPVADAGRHNETKTASPGITNGLQGDEPADLAIAAILKQLKSKWASGTLPEPSLDEDVMETIVMNTEPENDFSSLEKTIILSSGSALPSDNTLENRGDFFSEDDDFDGTIILPPKK